MNNEMDKEALLPSSKKIWAVGGGKGGVGKSLVSANVAICLALMGNKVVAVDLDLGGANLHTCLGLPIPSVTLSDYISKKITNFEDLLVPTPINNLKIIKIDIIFNFFRRTDKSIPAINLNMLTHPGCIPLAFTKGRTIS